jgi:hypothetical protein
MHYLAEELQRQRAEARDEVEAKERASTLNDDATFFSPNWANYTQHSVVPLHDAVCLAAGIKHDHDLFRHGWGFRMEPHATGGAKQALRNFVEWHKLAFHCATVRSGGLETTAGSESNHQVSLKMFAQWANANAIPLPSQFLSLLLDTRVNVREQRPKKTTIQELAVMDLIQRNGWTALNLPKTKNGNSGVKAELRGKALLEKHVFSSKTVFDKTWERLRKKNEIG